MRNDIIKIISVALIILTMVLLSIAKCIWPNLETAMINSALLQLLAALGVYHVAIPNKKDSEK
jgi:hypothetical protein